MLREPINATEGTRQPLNRYTNARSHRLWFRSSHLDHVENSFLAFLVELKAGHIGLQVGHNRSHVVPPFDQLWKDGVDISSMPVEQLAPEHLIQAIQQPFIERRRTERMGCLLPRQ